MDNTFTEIKKNFGFGCMRLPMVDGEVDMEQFKQMVDLFLEEGFNYFDTAHGYLDGKSELALREGLTSRYPRDRYLLVNKLTSMYFHKEEEIRPFFENQLKWCGVDYFDVYLMHAQNAAEFEKYKKCHAYETALQLKEEGSTIWITRIRPLRLVRYMRSAESTTSRYSLWSRSREAHL